MTKTIEVQDKFLLPMLKVEPVAEKVVEKILSGSSGVLVLPETANWLLWPLRMMPMWWQGALRKSAGGSVKQIETPKDVTDAVKFTQLKDQFRCSHWLFSSGRCFFEKALGSSYGHLTAPRD